MLASQVPTYLPSALHERSSNRSAPLFRSPPTPRLAGVVPPSDDATAAAAAGALVWRVEALASEHACHEALYDAVQVGGPSFHCAVPCRLLTNVLSDFSLARARAASRSWTGCPLGAGPQLLLMRLQARPARSRSHKNPRKPP
jgi:hypothetical protein